MRWEDNLCRVAFDAHLLSRCISSTLVLHEYKTHQSSNIAPITYLARCATPRNPRVRADVAIDDGCRYERLHGKRFCSADLLSFNSRLVGRIQPSNSQGKNCRDWGNGPDRSNSDRHRR